MSLIEAVKAIRGPEGTQVELTIIRNTQGEKTVIRKKVTRKKLSYPSVNHKVFTGEQTIGYIAISVIGEETEKLLKKSIEDLSQFSPQ
jgi:C-terminal processing protease CtpA/Prc